ncbi:hypothetical protein SpAn4DRAFT_2782 [Sporomusa ovata]|uniref:Uncharacterized protein n=1 Tax=Sporomusa ovata TaxID=2378 RepID=A0A0U1KY29_9FIRM|nr:hypothetical protein SpAn4DRAFT_2782 [Sporomusa ovata]
MLRLAPSDLDFKEITGVFSQKVSVLVRFKLLNDYSPVKYILLPDMKSKYLLFTKL